MKVLVIPAILLLTLSSNAANMLKNGEMETDSDWGPNGLVSGVNKKEIFFYDTKIKHSGKRSIRVTDTWDFARSYAICTVPVGQSAKGYRLTFWARAKKTQVFRAGIALQIIRPDGSHRSALWQEKDFTADTTWKQFSMEVPGKARVDNVLVFFGATAGRDISLKGTVWIDDAELTELDAPPEKRPSVSRTSGTREETMHRLALLTGFVAPFLPAAAEPPPDGWTKNKPEAPRIVDRAPRPYVELPILPELCGRRTRFTMAPSSRFA